MKLSFGDKTFMAVNYFLLFVLGFTAFYPFWNAAVISFNAGTDTMLGGITFWPRVFSLDNYEVVFKDKRLIDGFIISILRTVIGTLLSIAATAIFAYGMSKRNLVGRKYYMIFCVLTMYFSWHNSYRLRNGTFLRNDAVYFNTSVIRQKVQHPLIRHV